MTQSRPVILLTGFGSFPGIPENATAVLVPELAALARARFPDFDVIDAVLPVEWARAPLVLDQLLQSGDLALALHFGVAREASDLRIECLGRNVRGARQDAAGALPVAAHIADDAPDSLPSTFPVERIIARLQGSGLPCSVSDDAGTYLCNALLYHSLTAATARPRRYLAGFVHLPAALARPDDVAGCADHDCRLSWDDALAGGIEIIRASLETIA